MPQYFDSTASFPMKTKKRVYASGGRVGLRHGGPHNTGRMNLLEEEGRIRSEPQTRNVRAEEGRVIGELNRGYSKGGRVGLKKGGNGKWIQKATASIKKRGTEGKCTPITKPGCTGRAKALAKTFKKMARKRKG
jgi:hypothetical protein